VVESNHLAEFDRCHLNGFGESALQFELVFFVPDSDILLFLDLQQQIMLGIMEVFEEEKVEFAYPTQTLFLESANGDRQSAVHSAPHAMVH
jgi:MscS family membrane protein